MEVCEAQRAESACEDDPCAVCFVGKQRGVQLPDFCDGVVGGVAELLETVGEPASAHELVCGMDVIEARDVLAGGVDPAEQRGIGPEEGRRERLWARHDDDQLDEQDHEGHRKDKGEGRPPRAAPFLLRFLGVSCPLAHSGQGRSGKKSASGKKQQQQQKKGRIIEKKPKWRQS